jgi:hypothetical protein
MHGKIRRRRLIDHDSISQIAPDLDLVRNTVKKALRSDGDVPDYQRVYHRATARILPAAAGAVSAIAATSGSAALVHFERNRLQRGMRSPSSRNMLEPFARMSSNGQISVGNLGQLGIGADSGRSSG